jgi:DNA-binding NtrC family response regulator
VHIISALQRAEGVKKKAAELLGISRSTLDRKIEAQKIAL